MAGTLSAPPGASAEPLPGRRLAEIRSVAHRAPDGRPHTLTLAIEYHPAEPLRPREVAYLAGHRSGAELERDLRDLCAVLSALLRLGAEPAEIARALAEEGGQGGGGEAWGDGDGKRDGGTPGGSRTAAILAELARPPAWAAQG